MTLQINNFRVLSEHQSEIKADDAVFEKHKLERDRLSESEKPTKTPETPIDNKS